ncbi:hypothetical protein LCGC14_0030760 [marine sediment metagenome]
MALTNDRAYPYDVTADYEGTTSNAMTQTHDIATLLSDRFASAADAENAENAIAWLDHEGIMEVSGADAARFLQGQLTCDLSNLSLQTSTLGARCNPKGRMQSSFRLLKTTDTDYLLALSADLLQAQISELGKYAVFFKAKIADISAQWIRLGIWGPQAQQILIAAGFDIPGQSNDVTHHAAGLIARQNEDVYEVWLRVDHAMPALDALCQGATPVSREAWTVRQIRSGIGQINKLTYESFIPQMINLQQLGGVSFRKGCYTGQEIVARMQYLGKLKRRMYRLLLAGEAAPPSGTVIVDRDTGKPVGEVVLAARSNRMVEILAVLQKDAAQSVIMSVADSSGPLLTLADLPYEFELAASEADKEN